MSQRWWLFALFLSVRLTVSAQETAISFEMQSIFMNDTCAPPCWYGITPDESTYKDVISMFATHTEIVPLAHCCPPYGEVTKMPIIINGSYLARFQSADVYIWMLHNRVNSITIDYYYESPFGIDAALRRMGQPDLIYFNTWGFNAHDYNRVFFLIFIYLDELVNLTFRSIFYEDGDAEECDWGQWERHFNLSTVRYFSHDAALAHSDSIRIPDLFGMHSPHHSYAPPEIFASWLNADIFLCRDALQQVRDRYRHLDRKG
jgi:hypothetical protein